MAIAKVIYKENASATPEVWMDTTDKTAAAGNMLSGTTALKSDGTTATGNIATKTSANLSASGATVTAPAGYYAQAASKSVASGSASTPATSITANPSISVSSGGLITASVSASKSVTPTVSAGYVSSGTAGTVSVSGSNTSQLSVQAAQTIHPSTTDQTIASGKYLTGAQTVKAVTHNLDASKILSGTTFKIGDSTDDDCVASIIGTYSGGGGLEYEEGTYTPTSDIARPTIYFSNTHTTAPIFAMMADTSDEYSDTLNRNYIFIFADWYKLAGCGIYQMAQYIWYGIAYSRARTTNATSIAATTNLFYQNSDNPNPSSSENPAYFATNEFIRPYSSASNYWKSGFTYKWIAVWAPTT